MSQGYYDQGAMEYGEPPARRGNPAAIVSLVCGILGCIPILTGLLAVIFGIVGLNKARDKYVSGKGMSIAGLVLGVISLIGWGAFFALLAVGWGAYGKPTMVASRFAIQLSQGNVDAALADTSGIAREKLVADSDAMKAAGPIKGLSPNNFKTTAEAGKPATTTLSGFAIREGGPSKNRSFSISLIKVGDDYKVVDYRFD